MMSMGVQGTLAPDTVNILLKLVNSIATKIDSYITVSREHQDRVADYFDAIANTLTEIYTILNKGEIPHHYCGRLDVYAKQLPDLIGDMIGVNEAKEFSLYLHIALKLEHHVPHPTDSTEMAIGFERASGQFKGFADTLRARTPVKKIWVKELIDRIKCLFRIK